ncbi:MAG TPA: hypothetical protein PKA88_28340 [Polyangiaceae bacterium]|nr:hypothetical protein [Polyangiaceae bacterium]
MSLTKLLAPFSGIAMLVGAACTANPVPVVKEVIGPDGTQMLHVDCRGNEAECYQAVGRRCQAGYDLFWTVSRAPGRYLVRCRALRYAPPPAQPNWGWARETRPVDPWRPPAHHDGGPDVERYPSLDLGY